MEPKKGTFHRNNYILIVTYTSEIRYLTHQNISKGLPLAAALLGVGCTCWGCCCCCCIMRCCCIVAAVVAGMPFGFASSVVAPVVKIGSVY